MPKLNLSAAILLAAAATACAPQEEKRASVRDDAQLNHVLAVEADALVINGRHVRLANAAGPERLPRAHCWAEALAAREARARVTALATQARNIQVEPTGGRDEYGRERAKVVLDGLDLGDQLVDSGWAVRPGAEPFDWCAPVSTNMAGGPNVGSVADLGR
jgi:endonuclease YncB( thermonuclease family)